MDIMNSRDKEVTELIEQVREGGDTAPHAAALLEPHLRGGILPAELYREAKEVLSRYSNS